MKLDLNVNGKSVSVDVPPDMPLLWVLTRRAAHAGHQVRLRRGTVRRVHRAPARPRGEVLPGAGLGRRRRAVVTIEGLSPNGTHPLQVIWKELDVPDCGYCQGGQIMAAAALLATNPAPTDAQIDAAMNGNLCRCGTYLRIREGVRRAANNAAAGKGKETL